MPRLLLISWLLLPSALTACKCEMSLSACHEFAMSGVVFAGTVVSVTPSFLDRWKLGQRPSLSLLNTAEDQFHRNPSPAAFRALKDAFAKVFPDLPADSKRRLENATKAAELASVFDAVLDRGKSVRFRVTTVFRKDDDGHSDDPKDGGKSDDEKQFLNVFTPFGDCGYDFQEGEAYLVYADDDEDTSMLETTRCSRTNRLTDAGSDLAYLYFLQNSGDASGRLEGFVTTDVYYQQKQEQFHDQDRIGFPVSGAVVELQSGSRARYATTDGGGRFVFDGLPTGEYRVTAFASGFPDQIQALQDPATIHVETRNCAIKTILANPKPIR